MGFWLKFKWFIVFAVIIIVLGANALFVFNKPIGDFLFNLGVSAFNANGLDRASFYFNSARFFNPNDQRVLAYLCKIALRKNDVSADYCEATKVDVLKTVDSKLYLDTLFNVGSDNRSKADEALRSGDTAGSQKFCLESENNFKKYIEVASLFGAEINHTLYRLASTYFYCLNKPDDALKTLEQLVSREQFINAADFPANKSVVYNLLGRTYQYFDRHKDAEKMFKKAIALEDVPKDSIFNIHFHTNLAQTLMRESRTKEGFDELSLAKKINATYISVCDEAVLYYLAKDYKKAIEFGSNPLSKDNTLCWSILGRAYFYDGQKEKAREFLSKFMDFMNNYIERYREIALDIDYDVPAKSISLIKHEEITRNLLEELNK